MSYPIDFQKLVDQEKERLIDLCTVWEKYLSISDQEKKLQNGPPSSRTRSSTVMTSSGTSGTLEEEEGEQPLVLLLDDELSGLIRSTTGQGRMLLQQRFQQFESLVRDATVGRSDGKHISNQDLQGFWDMIYFQIDDMYKQFEILESAKDNNWKLVQNSNQNQQKENKKVVVITEEKKGTTTKTSTEPKKSNGNSSSSNSDSRSRPRPTKKSNIKDFIAKKRQEAQSQKMKEMKESFSALNV